MTQKVSRVVDLRGLIAPVTLLKVKQAFGSIETGETLLILGSDPETRRSLFRVLDAGGYEVVGMKEGAGSYQICLKKA